MSENSIKIYYFLRQKARKEQKMENNNEEKNVNNMSDEEVKAYADIIRNEAEAEKKEGKIKKLARTVKNWMSDHPIITLGIGIATGGIGVIIILLIVSAIAGGKNEEVFEEDISIDSDDDSLNVEIGE